MPTNQEDAIKLDKIDIKILKALQANARTRWIANTSACRSSPSCLSNWSAIPPQTVGNLKKLSLASHKSWSAAFSLAATIYNLRIVMRDLESYERFIKHDLAHVDKVAHIESTIILNQDLDRTVIDLEKPL